MLTEMEQNEILGRLDERSKSIREDVHSILDQLTKLNSKVATHEKEITDIKLKLAVTQGHWAGVNKMVALGLTLIGVISGVLAAVLMK